MQSDLQSVGNGAIGTFARAFAPKMCETAVSRLRMTWTFLQDLSRAVSRFSRCPVAGNPVPDIIIVFYPVGSEKYQR